MKLSIILLVFFLSFISPSVFADDYREIIDLTKSCYFNNNGESLPFVKGNNLSPDAIHFYLNLKRYHGNQLLINHQHPFAVFIEGELKRFTDDKTRLVWNIDSLHQVLDKKEVLVTIFSSDKNYDEIDISISRKALLITNDNDIFKIEVKPVFNRSVQLVVLLLIIGFLTIILNTNKKAFIDFYAFDLFLIGRVKDDSIYKSKLFSQGNLIVFIFHSTVLSFLILLLKYYEEIDFGIQLPFFESFFLNWIMYAILIQLFFIAKFLLIKYVGALFDLGSAANYYYYEFMRMSMIFFLLVFVVTAIFIVSFPSEVDGLINGFLYTILIFMSLRFIILFIRIGKVASFKKVHLFSYLCTTESIPILIGLKYLIF